MWKQLDPAPVRLPGLVLVSERLELAGKEERSVVLEQRLGCT
jgi:hypothetical protein